MISAAQQKDSVIYTFFLYSFHYDLSQDIEYSSLCYIVGLLFFEEADLKLSIKKI